MKNVIIYENNCIEDILSKIQLQKNHIEYTVGKTLTATIDVGKLRDHQEDSVLIGEHPENKDLKIIGVSDGVGGFTSGEIVSNHVVKKLILWFEKLSLEDFDNMRELRENLKTMIYHILDDLPYNYGAATLSCAIVGKEETLIVNIGDSRIYTYKNNRITQQTRDDSQVQFEYEEDIIPNKELMRFKKGSNVIDQAIEFRPYSYTPRTKIINNKFYDRIYAFTDGVTDCISEKELENIIVNSKEEATKEIVNKALNTNSYLWEEIDKLPEATKKLCYDIDEIMHDDYWQDIPAGKDNTTAVEYRKR